MPDEVAVADFILADDLGPLTSYSPTWSTGGGGQSIGNGSLAGRYADINGRVHFFISFRAGSTTNFGSGEWSFTLPFNVFQPVFVDYHWLGQLVDVGAPDTLYAMFGGFGGPNLVRPRMGSPLTAVTATSPFAWSAANQDRLFVSGWYWAA